MEFVNYCDFIRREGLSLIRLLYGSISFDIVESAFGENIHMTTVKIFANVHQLMFVVLKPVCIRIEYSLV